MDYKTGLSQKMFTSNYLVTTNISEAKLPVYSGQMSGGRACNTRTMRRLVGPRGTIAVNNAYDLCNKRLLHAQPAPRNSMLRNRSASEHRQRTCVPGYAISGAACTADVTCIRACHYARRATRYTISELHRYFRWCRSIYRLQLRTAVINTMYREYRRSANDIIMKWHVKNRYWSCLVRCFDT